MLNKTFITLLLTGTLVLSPFDMLDTMKETPKIMYQNLVK